MYYSSSAASSIYSQDGVLYPAPYDSDLAPLIERKDSSASTLSKSSKFSQASTLAPTVYTEEYIKTLGYRPFEYWKGPLPVTPGLNGGKRKTLLAPLPAPRAIHRRSRAFRDSVRDSLRAFGPGSLPRAKLRDSRLTLVDEAPRAPRPPPSPRVKDRYKHRYKLPRKEGEWPGWEPDEAVVRYFANRFANAEEKEFPRQQAKRGGSTKKKSSTTTKEEEKKKKKKTKGKGRKTRRVSWSDKSPLLRSTESDSGSIRLFAHHEHFFKPQTWTRRSWGIATALAMLLLGIILILASTLSHGNNPVSEQPTQTRVVTGVFVRASAERAVHGGSLFRFGPIRHTPLMNRE